MLELRGVSKFYRSEQIVSLGMSRVSLSFKLGEFVAVTGESGAGKSTLLNVISGLDGYDEGEMYLNGEPTSHYTIADFEKYRGTYVGFVFQNYNIIDSYTVLQNVLLALEIQSYDKGNKRARAIELIEKVGLGHRIHQKASKLSGGEKQRAVIARALAKDCPIIVADEPTGNLDSESGKIIMKLLKEISKEKLVIVVTHNYEEVVPYATRRIKMHDGKVIEDKVLKATDDYDEDKQYPEPKNMHFGSILRFALRNIVATPKKTIFVSTMFIIIIGLFSLAYAGVRSAIDSIPSLIEPNVLTALPETRMLATRRDGTPFSESDYNYFKGLMGEQNIKTHAEYMVNTAVNQYYSGTIARKADYAAYLNKRDVTFYKGYNNINNDRPYDLYISDDINLELGTVIVLSLSSVKDPFFEESYAISEAFTVVGKVAGGTASTAYFTDAYYKSRIKDPEELIKNSLALQIRNSKYILEANRININSNAPTDAIVISDSTWWTLSYYYGSLPQEGDLPEDAYFVATSVAATTKLDLVRYQVGKVPEYAMINIHPVLYASILEEHMSYVSSEGVLNYHFLSIHVRNKLQGRDVLRRFDNDTYRIYYPANVSDLTGQFTKYILGLFLFGLLLLVLLLLFFVLSLVTRNVMASRKKDFAIFRSIGATQQSLSKVVVAEQVIYGTFSALMVLIIFLYLYINVKVIQTILVAVNLLDLVFIFLVVLIFSMRLGFKFNKKIFKYSVIQTLAGEGADYL